MVTASESEKTESMIEVLAGSKRADFRTQNEKKETRRSGWEKKGGKEAGEGATVKQRKKKKKKKKIAGP